MSTLRSRVPSWGQILPVYGVIVLVVYAWTLLWFFWKVPGWLFFLNLGEILTALAYSLSTNLVESLLVLCAPLAAAIVLPRAWFRDVFVARGAALVLGGLGTMMYLAEQFKEKSNYPSLPLQPWTLGAAVLGVLLLVYVCGRFAPVRKAVESLADRMTIFVYILVPLSIISVVVVLFRAVVG
jgi:hypothetical protein